MTHIITSANVNYLMLIDNNFQYPAMLKVAGKHCVIIGGGAVAARKLQTLLDAGARVTVVAPEFCAELQSLAARCTLVTDSYKPQYLEGAFVVIAATSSFAVNREISAAAPCLVNNITEPELSNFTVPAFTRLLKTQLAQFITPELADFNDFLREQRDVVKAITPDSKAHTAFWRSVLNKALLNQVMAGETAKAKEKVLDAVNSFRSQSQDSPR